MCIKTVKCSLIKADEPTVNGRIYPREVLEKAIEEYNKKENNFGEFFDEWKQGGYQDQGKINLSQVSHYIINSWIDDCGYISCKIKLLDTPLGKILQETWSNKTEPFPCFMAITDKNVITEINDTVMHMWNNNL